MLARVLEEISPQSILIGLSGEEGDVVCRLEQKLRIFEIYYKKLYSSIGSSWDRIEKVLQTVRLPVVCVEHFGGW